MEEKALKKFHPSRFAFGKSYAASVLFMALGAFAFINPLDMALVSSYAIYITSGAVLVSFILAGLAEFRARTDTYTLTDYRIIESSGLFSIKETSIHWDRIANVSLHQSFLKRLMGIGTITVESTGGDDRPEITLRDITKAHDIKKMIDEKMLEKSGMAKPKQEEKK